MSDCLWIGFSAFWFGVSVTNVVWFLINENYHKRRKAIGE